MNNFVKNLSKNGHLRSVGYHVITTALLTLIVSVLVSLGNWIAFDYRITLGILAGWFLYGTIFDLVATSFSIPDKE